MKGSPVVRHSLSHQMTAADTQLLPFNFWCTCRHALSQESRNMRF